MYHCYMEISHSAEDVHDGHLLRDHEVSEPGQSDIAAVSVFHLKLWCASLCASL